MYKCDACGKEISKKNTLYGHIVCSKHMHQLLKYGKFIDNIQRTENDLNEFKIQGDIVIFDLYKLPSSEKVDEFIIDKDDLDKVRYHKWRLSRSQNGMKHVVTGMPAKNTMRDLSWVVLGLDNRDIKNKNIVVDHIDCNPLNNRKSNLRICTQSENSLNRLYMKNNTSGFIGVSFKKDRKTYDPEIKYRDKRCHLGATKDFKEAVYKRMVAERILYQEFANDERYHEMLAFTKDIPRTKKSKLIRDVVEKMRDKKIWQ